MKTENAANVEDGKAPEKTKSTDAIQEAIGSMGKYQVILCLIIFLTKFPVAFHQMGIIFLAPPVSYICLDNSSNETNKCPCSNPEYDTSIFQDTIIMTWDLICEKSWLADFTQTIFMLGILVGSISFGAISDRFGRRLPLVGAVILQLVSGIAASLTPEYWSFTILRFILGVATGGTMVVGYVLTMEFVGTEYREPVSAFYQLPFNIGHLMLAGFGYFFRTWSSFQLAVTIPSVVMLSYYWVLPESPRWLLAVGETKKASKILEKTAKMNKLPTENIANNIEEYQRLRPKDQIQKGNLFDLFKTPNLRRNTICMTFNWLVCGFGYFGVSQYIGKLAGNIFVNVAVSATVTIPGTLISIPLMRRFGRKPLMIGTLVLTSICLFAIAVIPADAQMWQVVLACIGDVGMFIAFIVVYLYASEMFPTVVRNVGIGLSSMMARVGSMVAPYVASLGTYALWLPPVIFAIMPLIGASLCLLMPETKDCELLTTIEEAENFRGTKKDDEK
ncbi:organic cation transporter protein-like isoform X2 [Arctopsyche grandis]|uniref:organic cation transporter protein-like isoform X2 n=1 Tax=Arctopsyche grandis TaxID=121162 RepID=UPI00406D9FC3